MEINGKVVDEPLRIRKFEVGDLVFAKLKGYPPWPSKIQQIEESIGAGGKEKIRYNVYFYGTHQSSILRSSSLYHYDTYAKSIVDKWGRKPKFHEALKELEREMMAKITYLNQLRTTTPDSTWCHGFNTVCESLANDIDGAQGRAKSKNHCKPKKSVEVHDIQNVYEDEILDESRRLGYEVMYMERIPFPDTPEHMIVLSLNFNKEWVKEESERIKEEERMMNCYVRIEPFPPKYAHLDPSKKSCSSADGNLNIKIKDEENVLDQRLRRRSQRTTDEAVEPAQRKNSFVEPPKQDPISVQDVSDEEVVETCPVCRVCFFSLTDLRNHEQSVHGTVSTAESLFDRLMSGNENKKEEVVTPWKEGYPLDSII